MTTGTTGDEEQGVNRKEFVAQTQRFASTAPASPRFTLISSIFPKCVCVCVCVCVCHHFFIAAKTTDSADHILTRKKQDNAIQKPENQMQLIVIHEQQDKRVLSTSQTPDAANRHSRAKNKRVPFKIMHGHRRDPLRRLPGKTNTFLT